MILNITGKTIEDIFDQHKLMIVDVDLSTAESVELNNISDIVLNKIRHHDKYICLIPDIQKIRYPFKRNSNNILLELVTIHSPKKLAVPTYHSLVFADRWSAAMDITVLYNIRHPKQIKSVLGNYQTIPINRQLLRRLDIQLPPIIGFY